MMRFNFPDVFSSACFVFLFLNSFCLIARIEEGSLINFADIQNLYKAHVPEKDTSTLKILPDQQRSIVSHLFDKSLGIHAQSELPRIDQQA